MKLGNAGTRTSPIQLNAYLFVMLESLFLVFGKTTLTGLVFFFFPPVGNDSLLTDSEAKQAHILLVGDLY